MKIPLGVGVLCICMSVTTTLGTEQMKIDGSLDDDHDISEKTRVYANKVVKEDSYQLNEEDINLDDVIFGTSTRAKRRHGVCKFEFGVSRILISESSVEKADFDTLKSTIQHELVHAWQYQHSGEYARFTPEEGVVEYADSLSKLHGRTGTIVEVNTGHKDSFRVWEQFFDFEGRCSNHYTNERTDYNYVLVCEECQNWYGKHRMCKSVRQTVYGHRICGACESELHLVNHNGKKFEDMYETRFIPIDLQIKFFFGVEDPEGRTFTDDKGIIDESITYDVDEDEFMDAQEFFEIDW